MARYCGRSTHLGRDSYNYWNKGKMFSRRTEPDFPAVRESGEPPILQILPQKHAFIIVLYSARAAAV